jgi:hypothetical protein
MQVVLGEHERDALIETVAEWSVRCGLGAIVSFLLECNRPVAPLTGQACIACAPLINAGFPWPVHNFGLLLQDGAAVARLQRRIEELTHESDHAVT